jgi:hypothetical protein
MSFFSRRRAGDRHTTPQREGADTHVIVKRTNRDHAVDGFAPPDQNTVDLIREHLPNRPRAPDAPLRAALVARAYRCSLRAGRRLSDEEGSALANAVDELSAFVLKLGKGGA